MSTQVLSVIDLAFGDSGKGAHVDYLCRINPVHTVVRFNGGSQAGHNVVLPDGTHHCFNTFGSGSFVDGVDTYLTQDFLFDMYRFIKERDALSLKGVNPQVFIHEDAPLVTPWHIAVNRIKEVLRGNDRHGSCGLGVGEAACVVASYPARVPRIRHIKDLPTLVKYFSMVKYLMWGEIILQVNQLSKEQRELLKLEFEYFHDNEWIETYAKYVYAHRHFIQIVDNSFFEERLQQKGTIVFEGAQGVLLDEDWGFHPYTTWSHTTTKNIKKILDYHRFDGLVHNYGLIRAYHTRHGAGPFPTELPMSGQFYEDHNVTNSWQSNFRVGPLDLDLIIYAQLANYNAADADLRFDIHSLVISCFDKFFGQKSIPVSFPYDGSCDEEFTLDRNDFTKREIITKFYQKSKPDFFDLIFSDDPISTKDILPFVEQMKIETGLTVSVVSVSPTWEGRINIQELIEKRGEVNTMDYYFRHYDEDAMAAATATAEADQAAATQAEAGVAEGVSNTAPEAE